MDLVLRPGETDLPPVQALLTIVASVQTALGGDGLGEVDGKLVSAEMARQLARAFAGLSPQPTSDAATPGTTGGRQPGAVSDTAADPVVTGSGATGRRLDPPPGEEPIDTDGGPIDRAAAELGSKDFDRWLDDLVRAAFGDAPASGDPGWSPGRPPDPAEWDTGPWGDRGDAVGLEEPGSAAPATPSSDAVPSPDGTTPPGDGWWAAADRAVEEAGTAVHGARLALGAAERVVCTAQRADAADETAWQASPAGRVNAAPDALTALAGAAASQREELAALLMTTAGGGLADRPRLALTDAVTGALLALTDLPALRRHLRRPRLPSPARGLRPRPDRPSRPGRTRAQPGLPTRDRPGPVRARPRPALPLPRLPPSHPQSGRTGPRRRPSPRAHCRGQPGRLLHRRPPRQAPGTRLGLPAPARRHSHRHHTDRPDRRHRTTALLSEGAQRTATAGGPRTGCQWTGERPVDRRCDVDRRQEVHRQAVERRVGDWLQPRCDVDDRVLC
jgi:hypothetical protein